MYLSSVFSVKSTIQESIGMSPAELQLGRKLPGSGDKLFQLQENSLSPSDPSYDVVNHIAQLKERVKENCILAKKMTSQEL